MASDPAALGHRDGPPVADHEMVEQAHIDQGQGLLELDGELAVGGAGFGDAARVVVRHQHGRGVAAQGLLHEDARVHAGAVDGALGEDALGDQAMAVVEEQGGEALVRCVAQPAAEILAGAVRVLQGTATIEFGLQVPAPQGQGGLQQGGAGRPEAGQGAEPGGIALQQGPQAAALGEQGAGVADGIGAAWAGAEQQGQKLGIGQRLGTVPQQALARAFGSGPVLDSHAGMVAADPAAGCRKPVAAGVSFRLDRGEEQGVSALHGQRVLLGVSGGIAAYKSAELVRRLREAGAEVRVVMTAGAEHFITATTLQAVSGHPVRSSLWDAAAEAAMGHIELARWATRVLIAPATADLLARLAQGRADDLLATLCLATEAPLAVAPAMNRLMWANPATQANLALLRQRGVAVFGPDAGDQACGEVGEGRMREPAALVADLAATLGPRRLAGHRVLVSAGPTFEDIDPVRFLGNRSSGRMGFAVAEAAAAAGAEVTLVAGPVKLPTPAGVARIDVRSAAEMHAAVLSALPGQDAYVGAAAVADYRPVEVAGRKIKKSEGPVELRLERTADILAEVAAHPQRPRCVLGFAAETHDVESYARGKLAAKRLDAIAANRVGLAGQGFDSEDNALTLYWDGGERDFGPAPKAAIARGLVDWIAEWLARA